MSVISWYLLILTVAAQKRSISGSWWQQKPRTHLSRPKMKELSLMLWLVSSEYWLTFENRLWRIRVDGPERDKQIWYPRAPSCHPTYHAIDVHCNLTCKQTCKLYQFDTKLLTQLCGGLHQAPGLTPPLADDQVQHVGLQTVLQHLMQRRAQVLQDEVTHVGTHPAVPQFSLVGSWRNTESCTSDRWVII